MNMDSINTNINPKKYRFDTAYSNEKITRDSIIKFYEDAMDNKIAQFYNGEYMDEEEKEINEELFGKFKELFMNFSEKNCGRKL